MNKSTFLAYVIACLPFASITLADITVESWDVILHEAYTRCERIPTSGSAQLSEDDMAPPPGNNGTVVLNTNAFIDDPDSESTADAYVDVSTSFYTDGGDGYYVTITNEAYLWADAGVGGLTESISAQVEGYFDLAIYVPVGETWQFEYEFVEMNKQVEPDVDFNDSAWHMTFQGGGWTGNGSMAEGVTGTLVGRNDPYMLYGGFEFSATDTVTDAIGIYGEVFQILDMHLTPAPDPSVCEQRAAYGDFNCDTTVGLLDLDILGQNWGATGLDPATGFQFGDANTDGDVGLLDLDILGSNWGNTVTPEPTGLGILILAGITATYRRESA